MTATGQQDASSRKNSLSLEEGLPLYAELQYTEGQTDMLPHAKASPMEVSDFLLHLLTESRDMSTDGARRLAALWTKGTGQELRSFPPAMYFEIFGKEDGWIVYREVHMALYRERSKEFSYGPFVVLAIALCLEFTAIGVTIAGAKHLVDEAVMAFAGLIGLLNGIFCVGLIVMVSTKGDHGNAIEGELRRALERDDRPQS